MGWNIGARLAETAQGFLDYITNELRNYAKDDDTPKFRQGSNGKAALFALSANLVVLDPGTLVPTDEIEIGLEQWKLDERYRDRILAGDRSVLCAERTVHLRRPRVPGQDDALKDDDLMIPILLLRHDSWTPLVPFVPWSQLEHGPSIQVHQPAPPETLGAAGRPHQFQTDDGAYVYNFQGPASGQPAGRGVKYATNGFPDDPSKWTAVSEVVEQPL